MEETRIYGDSINLNHDNVKHVFNHVALEAKSKLGSCMLDMENKYAEQRHKEECKRLQNMFNGYTPKMVLDLGCGIGRLRNLFPNSKYVGVDFCDEYINVASQQLRTENPHTIRNTHFYKYDVSKISDILYGYRFDVVLMCGICMYLSDDELNNLFSFLSLNILGNVYMRESVSVLDTRLTLKDFPSDDLKISYSAIYRTREEYKEIIEKKFLVTPNVSELLQTKPLRSETNQAYFTWKIL